MDNPSLMMFHEPMIHLTTSPLKCIVSTSQDDLDGIYALVTWLDGYVSNGSADAVPGQYELLMLYRRLRAASISQSKKNG